MREFLQNLRDYLTDLEISPATQDLLLVLLAITVILLARLIIRLVVVRWIRRLAKNRTTEWEQQTLDTLRAPINFLVLALILQAVIEIGQVDGLPKTFMERMIPTLVIIAVLMVAYRIGSIATRNVGLLNNVTGINIEPPLLPFIRNGVRLLIILFGLTAILEQWGYDVATLAAGLGIGGLALALAAQDTLANLFGFTMIIGDRPLVEGEYIKTPDVEGTVEDVGLRSTRIRQLNQAIVTVPNSKLASSVVLNWSRLRKRQIDFVLTINRQATRQQMEQLLGHIRYMLQQRPLVEAQSVQVFFVKITDNALEVLVRCYVKLPDWGAFTAEQERILLDTLSIVEAVGLSVSAPTQSLVIEKLPDEVENMLDDIVDMSQKPTVPARPQGRTATPPPPPPARRSNSPQGDNSVGDTPNDSRLPEG